MIKEAPQMIPQSRGNRSQLTAAGWCPSTRQGPVTTRSTCYIYLKRLFADQSTLTLSGLEDVSVIVLLCLG